MAHADCQAGVKISLFLGHRCNLRCRYCYNGPAFDRSMTSETARRAVDFAFARARGEPLVISFFGGEPLLEIALVEQVMEHARTEAASRDQPLRFSVATNATLLDERRLRALGASDVHVQASIDGCEEAHAHRRFANGRSSWRRAMENLARMLAAGIDVQVVAVVHPDNARLLPASFAALRETGVRRIHFVPNLAAGWSDRARDRLDAGLAALADLWAASLRDDDPVRMDPFHGKVAAHIMQGTRLPARCAFGTRELAISPRGRIYPCDRMVKDDADDEMCLGALDTGVDDDKLAELTAARDDLSPECAACDLLSRCAPYCGCANYEQTGHPGHVAAERCMWERAVIAHADRVANQLYAEQNPAFLRRFYARALAALSVPSRAQPSD